VHANIDDVTETTSVGTDNSDSQRTENIDTNFDGISNLALSDTTLDVSEITRSYVPEDEPSEPFIEKIAEDIDADDTFNEEAYEQTDLAAGMNLPPDDGWSISYPPSKSNSYITTVNINGNSDDEEDKPKQDSDSIYVGFER
jgi:hypothetical protein